MLIVENWKYYNKIIFKYINSIIWHHFKEKFIEICTYEVHKQYTELKKHKRSYFFTFHPSKPSLNPLLFLCHLWLTNTRLWQKWVTLRYMQASQSQKCEVVLCDAAWGKGGLSEGFLGGTVLNLYSIYWGCK